MSGFLQARWHHLGILTLIIFSACHASPEGAADLDGPLPEERARALAQLALTPFTRGHGLAGLQDLAVTDIRTDEVGEVDVRVQQQLDGIPVEGAQAIVHLDALGALLGVTDQLVDAMDLDTTPWITHDEAIERAVEVAGGWQVLTGDPQASLIVATRFDEPRLIWRVQTEQIDGSPDTRALAIRMDAHTGEVLSVTDGLKGILGTGRSNYFGTVALRMVKPVAGGYYYLENATRRVATYSMLGTDDSAAEVFDADSAFTWSWQREAVDVHYASDQVLEFLYKIHGWSGLTGTSGPGTMTSLFDGGKMVGLFVNYGDEYNGAFWYGNAGYFGDGDGVTWEPLTSLDLVGHELGHGFTSIAVGFEDSGEAAAIDEGYADVVAAMAERYVYPDTGGIYKIGEDAYTPDTAYDAVRYLNDPARDGVTVDHYDDYDSAAGPEVNMGILSLAFYLLAEGGRHPTYGGTLMDGIGADYAQAIAFRAVKKYSTSAMTFADTRNAWLDAAAALYGADSESYTATMSAWALVGVGVSASVATCTDYLHPYSSTLTSGTSKYYPSTAGGTYAAGSFAAAMEGPSDADFDIFLQQKVADAWTTIEKSKTSGSSSESLTGTGTAGTYRLQVKATSGSGDFVACLSLPLTP